MNITSNLDQQPDMILTFEDDISHVDLFFQKKIIQLCV